MNSSLILFLSKQVLTYNIILVVLLIFLKSTDYYEVSELIQIVAILAPVTSAYLVMIVKSLSKNRELKKEKINTTYELMVKRILTINYLGILLLLIINALQIIPFVDLITFLAILETFFGGALSYCLSDLFS